jgi:glycosyltransferase involved in cell wall biosynthesis
MRPTITVGIPFFNSATTLFDTIRSVFAQSFTDWELLLVDDGSTDNSLKVARSIDDPRVRVISDGINRGLVHRLNQMIALARAPYFARMDADDLMHPERLARQLDYLRSQPEIDIIGSAVYVIDRQGRPYGIRGDRPANIATASIRAGFIHPSVMARTEWFRKHPYDADFVRAEDLELWRRAGVNTGCARLMEPMLFYREPLEFQPAKYRISCRTVRKIARRYAPDSGHIATIAAIVGTYAKEALHLTLARAGLASTLIRRRNRKCAEFELHRASQTLQQIRRVEVPRRQTLEVLPEVESLLCNTKR